MRHVNPSFFLSGLYLFIEIGLSYICFSARVYPIGGFFLFLTFLELYRLSRKIHFLKSPISREELEHRRDLRQQANSYYWNQWYRFADAHEHEYIAQNSMKTSKRQENSFEDQAGGHTSEQILKFNKEKSIRERIT